MGDWLQLAVMGAPVGSVGVWVALEVRRLTAAVAELSDRVRRNGERIARLEGSTPAGGR